jgi:hypothetical protein
LAGAIDLRQQGPEGAGLLGADERPVMQDFRTEFSDMRQFPGDKAGQLRAEWDKFKLIRTRAPSEATRFRAAFAVHP